ncbi:MAG: hypothetical protein PF517_20355 [Salinivirgaceae bacterium]|jgi:hypothetical protein|nr:hypothetical protein [Salinivirgaceae bacterium]
MSIRIKLKVSLFIVLCLLGSQNKLVAQQSFTDSTPTDTVFEEFSSYLSFDISFSNNNLASSNTQSSSSSAILSDISFYHKSGFWGSLMPANYPTAEISSYDIDATLGYLYLFSNGFDINTYYLHHSYIGDTILSGINYEHSLNFSVGYTFGGFYAYTDAYSLWGNTSNYFTDVGIGYYHEWLVGKKGFNNISIFPFLSCSFGTDYWMYDNLESSDFYQTKLDLLQNGYSWNTFDMQSIDLMLPVTYTLKNLAFSVSYLYSVPTKKYSFLGWDKQSALMLSINYMLIVK